MKPRQIERLLVFAVIVLMAFYAFNRFVYVPAKVEIGKLKKEQAELAKKIQTAKINTRSLPGEEAKLEKQINEFQTSKERLALGADQVTTVLAALADNADRYSVKLQLIKPGQLESLPEVSLKKLAIKVSFTGDYKNISDYLVSLEKLPARMIIQELKLNRQSGDAPEIAGEFTLVTIYEE